jgi:hypothetical protein
MPLYFFKDYHIELSYENAKKLIKNVDIIAKAIDARGEMNENELPTLLYRGKPTVANALEELHVLQKNFKIFAILLEEAKSFLNISNGECKILGDMSFDRAVI